MSNETDWDELSDEYTEHTPAIIGETIRPQRAITMDDIDDIFAGRPLADQPRRKAALRVLAPMTTPMVRATALMVVAAGSAHVQPHTGPRLMALGTARRVADALEMTIDEFESRL